MTSRVVGPTRVAVGGGAVVLVRQLQQRTTAGTDRSTEARSRWRAVTINRGPEDVMPDGRGPGPLAELGDLVEVEVRPAPGDKGSELPRPAAQPGTHRRRVGGRPRCPATTRASRSAPRCGRPSS